MSWVSGLPPIRANKLKYYKDKNFTDRLLPAPDLKDQDCPQTRADDWTDITSKPDPRLEPDAQDVEKPSMSNDGGLKRHPELEEATPKTSKEVSPEELLLDDDLDSDLFTDPAPTTIARAYGVNSGDDDDLMPSF